MLIQPSPSHLTSNRDRAGRRSTAWIHGPLADIALGWCWLPVFVVIHQASGSLSRTQALMGVVFLVSFAHQPLTLGLVYADPAQRSLHRRLYRWAPIAVVAAVLIGTTVSLTLVGVVAGLWNAEHTLMQRYGVIRIYGRKAGDDHGRIEKPMLIVWLITALAYLAAFVDLPALAARIGLDRTNAESINALHRFGGPAAALFWIGAAGGLALAWRWIMLERSASFSAARRAKWIYTSATFGMVVAVMVDPIAGVAGYVAAHSIEYFGIVHNSLRRRANALASGEAPSALAIATATAVRRGVVASLYVIAVAVFVAVTVPISNGEIYGFAILFFGALHILYDGFVWKLRRPAVAASLGIDITGATAGR